MCDKHTHAKVETWITPESSRHLSAKMIGLFPGEAIPDHTTGPEREEVIVCVYGTIEVAFDSRIEIVTSGNAVFIPENTHHAVLNNSDAPAQYAYVATNKKAAEERSNLKRALKIIRDDTSDDCALHVAAQALQGKPFTDCLP